jgi:mono/diheme cytochrome c family protein
MKVYRIPIGALVAAAAVSVASAQSGGPPPAKPSPELLAAGRKVYDRERCLTCHQIAKHGNSRFPLDGVGTRLTPEQIRRWITHTSEMEDALPKMPPVRMSAIKYRLSAADLDALVAYLGSLK